MFIVFIIFTTNFLMYYSLYTQSNVIKCLLSRIAQVQYGQTCCFCFLCLSVLFFILQWIALFVTNVATDIGTSIVFFLDDLVLHITRATCNVIMGVLNGGAMGSKGLSTLFSDGYRYLTLGALLSSTRTLSAIIFILVAIAVLAKFTLTKRPKDFIKWVSMPIVIFPKHALCAFVCSDLFHTLLMILCMLLGIFL